MRPDIDALVRFPIFRDFRPEELATVARRLTTVELEPGEVLFEEGAAGGAMYFHHMGRIQIDRESTPGAREVLAELEPPTILGEMAILDQAPRSARAVAMRPTVLWEIKESSLADLAAEGDAAAYKIMRWIAQGLSARLRMTNDKLIEIYAKPFQSIMELKERIRDIRPGVVSMNFDPEDDGEAS